MYGPLNSPLPGLTVSPNGCRSCGMRGHHLGMLGDDVTPIDTTYTDPGNLTDPTYIIDPTTPIDISTLDPTQLPLPNQLSPSINSMYPATVGTEFTSNGDGTYTNIQTGQSVPYSTAMAVTNATGGVVSTSLQSASNTGTLVDPNSGTTISTNNLTTAAQALQAAGQLLTAAGKLTAQGQALLNAGNLYNAAPATPATGISGAMASLTAWMSGSTLFPGLPNMAVVGGAILLVMVLPSMMSGKRRR